MVILDINLSDQNGLDVLQEIKYFRRLPEINGTEDAGFSFSCKARPPAHGEPCNGGRNAAGERKDKSAGTFIDRNRLNPNLPVLTLSILPEFSVAVRAFKAGANGYLDTENVPEELVWAVRKVTGGGKYFSPSLTERLASKVGGRGNDTPHERLSQHEYRLTTNRSRSRLPSSPRISRRKTLSAAKYLYLF